MLIDRDSKGRTARRAATWPGVVAAVGVALGAGAVVALAAEADRPRVDSRREGRAAGCASASTGALGASCTQRLGWFIAEVGDARARGTCTGRRQQHRR